MIEELPFTLGRVAAGLCARRCGPKHVHCRSLPPPRRGGRSRHFHPRGAGRRRWPRPRALGEPDGRPLWGVPFAVKDNIDVAGMPTTAACPDFAYTAETDAFVVAKLQEAGAICLGKTNLDQFATGLVGVRTPYPVPRNALDPAYRAGRLLLRLGGRGGARHRGLRARHRYGRLRPRAGGAERHRRAEADARRAVGDRHGAGLPHARHDLDFRHDRRRCLGSLRHRGRLRSGRRLFAQVVPGRACFDCRRPCASACRIAATLRDFRRHRPGRRISAQTLEKLRAIGATLSRWISGRSTPSRACSTKAHGWPSA